MPHARTILIGLCALSLVVAEPVFGSGEQAEQTGPEARAVTVEIRNIEFAPSEIVVPAGTTINWLNLDPVDHDVTSGLSVIGRSTRNMKQTKFPDNKFSSGLFGKGKTFSVTLQEKGEYKYYCNIHPFMIGRIIVK